MARAHIREVFLDAEGRPLVGATVHVYQQGTTTTITETIYTVDDSVGSTTTTSPLTTDSQGAIEFYLAAEKRVDLKLIKTGYQDVTETYDVLVPGAAAGASALDDLTDVTITAAASGDLLRHNGTAWVDATLSDGDIPATIARDSEVTTAVSNHEAAADPHTGYQKESEKNAASGYAGLTASTKLNLAQMQEVMGIADLSDVTITAAASGDFLRHNGTAWVDATISDGDIPSTIARDSEVVLQTLADAKGDIVVASAADTFTRLAAGTNGQVLTADSAEATGVKWAAAGGGGGSVATDTIWDAVGDLAVGSGADTASRLAKGTDFQFLRSRAAAALDVEWAALLTAASVAANESTTSTSYTDLTTSGPAVTLTTGTTALIILTADMYNSADQNYNAMSFAVSGATTLAADDARAYVATAPGVTKDMSMSWVYPLTGLTAGSNTFTAKYRVGAGTGNFLRRHITVITY